MIDYYLILGLITAAHFFWMATRDHNGSPFWDVCLTAVFITALWPVYWLFLLAISLSSLVGEEVR